MRYHILGTIGSHDAEALAAHITNRMDDGDWRFIEPVTEYGCVSLKYKNIELHLICDDVWGDTVYVYGLDSCAQKLAESLKREFRTVAIKVVYVPLKRC